MAIERGSANADGAIKEAKPGGLLGSLKDALRAAGRDDAASPATPPQPVRQSVAPVATPQVSASAVADVLPPLKPELVLSAADAARVARTMPGQIAQERRAAVSVIEPFDPPTTRVVRQVRDAPPPVRTRLVRGRQTFARSDFAQDPVVAFLIVVGGPGLGASRPVFEGNNTVGRTAANRISLDFGDDAISAEEQAYIRYNSTDRSFLFVPNLAKTNVVSVNDKRPAGAVELKSMDVLTFGRTQVAFLPFCGPEFDWSEISDVKDE